MMNNYIENDPLVMPPQVWKYECVACKKTAVQAVFADPKGWLSGWFRTPSEQGGPIHACSVVCAQNAAPLFFNSLTNSNFVSVYWKKQE